MNTIEELWVFACSGNIKALRQYYNSNDTVVNKRYVSFGTPHSLIMGAFNNNQFKTVEFLIEQGETVTRTEYSLITKELRRIETMKKIRDNCLGL